MGLGLVGTVIAGGMSGLTEPGRQLGKYASDSALQAEATAAQEKRDLRISELRKGEAVFGEDLRREGKKTDFEFETDPANVARKGAAAARLIEAQIPAKVSERTALGDADTDIELKRFQQLAPLKRQEAIDTEVAKMEALATPEMLKAARQIAQAKHIVDPSYTFRPGEGGTMIALDQRSGKSHVVTGADNKPIISKDPEVLKAATSVMTKINDELRIARAEHQSALANAQGDPKATAVANEEWKLAKEKADRLATPVYAVLLGKSGVPAAEPASKVTGSQWDDKTGDVIVDGVKTGKKAKSKEEAQKIVGEVRSGKVATDPAGLDGVGSTTPQRSNSVIPAVVPDSWARNSQMETNRARLMAEERQRLIAERDSLGTDRQSAARRRDLDAKINSMGE